MNSAVLLESFSANGETVSQKWEVRIGGAQDRRYHAVVDLEAGTMNLLTRFGGPLTSKTIAILKPLVLKAITEAEAL